MKRGTSQRSYMRRMLPFVGLLGIALAANGCDQTPTSRRTEPSVTAPSPSPTPLPPPSPTPNAIVTGTVSGEGQALANVRVEVRLVERNSYGRVDLITDASGRYRADIANGASLQAWVTAYHPAFRFQPCAAGFQQSEPGPSERIVDVNLISVEGLSQLTPTRVAGNRTISGTIYTLTSTGKQPVADAVVLWDFTSDDFQAWTKTDSSGRFTLCGLPVNSPVVLFALKGAAETYQQGWLSVGPGSNDVDVEVIVKRP
jgi:hypothetical protein